MKAELDTLKSNFKSVLSVRAEIEFLKKSVKDMKEEMQQLKTKNIDVKERVKHVEEEIENVSDDESDSEVDLSPVKAKLTYENSLKQKGQECKVINVNLLAKQSYSSKDIKIPSIPFKTLKEKVVQLK